jgi:CheY-like chemotaxis protein
MKPKGLFVFVDDDEFEHEMFGEALARICSNEVKYAFNGDEALRLIKANKDRIFMIISDINMPKVNGLELKRMIEGIPELKLRAIPFIFTSNSDEPLIVKEAFSLGIQGYIKKSDNLSESVSNLDILVKFWSSTVHPNRHLV